MIYGLFNDCIQRFITLNKFEQRSILRKWLRDKKLGEGCKVLDFGCGTGLFASVFKDERCDYYGYDIDARLIKYADRLYHGCRFTHSIEVVNEVAPFDLILANCCFHHIEGDLLVSELKMIKGMLNDNGTLLIIDDLKAENDISFVRGLFRKIEKGRYLRTVDESQNIIARHFAVKESNVQRAHIMSISSRYNFLYRELVYFECKKHDESYRNPAV